MTQGSKGLICTCECNSYVPLTEERRWAVKILRSTVKHDNSEKVKGDGISIQDTEGYQSPYISTPQVSQGKSWKHQLICPLSETVPGWGQRAPAECCDPHSRQRAGEKPRVLVTPHSSPFHAFWLRMLQRSGGFLVGTLVKTSGKAALATKLCSMRANRKSQRSCPC